MPKKMIEEMQKHTLLLFAGDYAKLQALYPDLGAAAIIRMLVHTHLKKIDPPIEPDTVKGDLFL